MSAQTSRRSGMVLYSRSTDPYSHKVRIVLAEKGVEADILDVDQIVKAKEELFELNPYGKVPMLMDRDLVLYQPEIIMEYLDERFPHPSLMPVYPIARARCRLVMYRLNRDWYGLMDKILAEMNQEGSPLLAPLRKELQDSITSVAPAFAQMPFFMNEEFSLVDCSLAPLLWRLPWLGVILPPQAGSILAYAERIFKRESFVASLTEAESAMKNSEVS